MCVIRMCKGTYAAQALGPQHRRAAISWLPSEILPGRLGLLPTLQQVQRPFLLPKEWSVCGHFSPPFRHLEEVQALSKLCGITCAGFQGNFGST